MGLGHHVPIRVRAGAHYPELDRERSDAEKERRWKMLELWGITRFEKEMEVELEGAAATTLKNN